MTTRKAISLFAISAGCMLAACGSDSAKNLKAVFFRTVPTAPVATVTLQQQNGDPIQNASVTFESSAVFDGWRKVGTSITATTGPSGSASRALTAGTYPMLIQHGVPFVGDLNDTLTISQDVIRSYQTSKQTWTVTSAKAFSDLHVEIYQVDSGGKVTPVALPAEPVLSVSPTVPAAGTQATFSTELFKGNYRALIIATPANAADVIAPFESATFAAAGGGALETQTAALSSGGNIVSLHFMEDGAPLTDTLLGQVFDAASLIPITHVWSTQAGSATVSTGTVSNVVVAVAAGQLPGGLVMMRTFTASPTHSETLTRYSVAGHAKFASPLTQRPDGTYGKVAATLKTSLGSPWDEEVVYASHVAAITDDLGTYELKLFAGTWSLQAVDLADASSGPVTVTVSADVAAQDIRLDQGGVIAGTIQDESHDNLAGVHVDVYDSTHQIIADGTTDASGNFSIRVPFGTWSVIAGAPANKPEPPYTPKAFVLGSNEAAGALTKNVSVSSGAPTRTLNLTRFKVRGRLTDNTSAPVAGRVYSSAGETTADSLGLYTLDVIEGLNWFVFVPDARSLGHTHEMDVMVNAEAMKALQQ